MRAPRFRGGIQILGPKRQHSRGVVNQSTPHLGCVKVAPHLGWVKVVQCYRDTYYHIHTHMNV